MMVAMAGLPTLSAPWEALAFAALLLVAPAVAEPLHRRWHLPSLLVVLVVALFASSGPLAYAAVAAGALLHARSAWRESRTGSAMLILSAVVSLAVTVALMRAHVTMAFALSC